MSGANLGSKRMSVLTWGSIVALLVGVYSHQVWADGGKRGGDTKGINSTSGELPLGASGEVILTLFGADKSSVFEGPVNIKGGLYVSNMLSMTTDGGLVLNGNASIYGDLFTKGVTHALGGLNVNDKVTISPDGVSVFTGDVTVGGRLSAQKLLVKSDLEVNGNAVINGTTVLKGDVTVTGSVVVGTSTINDKNIGVLDMLAAALASCKVGAPLTVGPNKTLACGDTTPSCVATSETRATGQYCLGPYGVPSDIEILQKRDYTCVQNVGKWGAWYNFPPCPSIPLPACTPTSETRTVACSQGTPAMSGDGTIDQQRDYTCTGSNGTWSAWRNVKATCVDMPPARTPECTQVTTLLNCELYRLTNGGRPDKEGAAWWTVQAANLGAVASDQERLILLRQQSALYKEPIHYAYTKISTRDIDPVTGWGVRKAGLPLDYVEIAPDKLNEAQIYSLYANYAWREPDAKGLAFWLQRMKDGATIAEVEASFKKTCHGPGSC